MNVFLGLLMLTDHTRHTRQPNLKANHSLIWKLIWKQIPWIIDCTYLETNHSFWLQPLCNISFEQHLWTLVAHPLASTNPSSTLPWTTDPAPRRYASRLLPPQMSRRKAWVSAVCWEPLEVNNHMVNNHGLQCSRHILKPLWKWSWKLKKESNHWIENWEEETTTWHWKTGCKRLSQVKEPEFLGHPKVPPMRALTLRRRGLSTLSR